MPPYGYDRASAGDQPEGEPLYDRTFRPRPRDRDQSFTLWNGLLTYLANRGVVGAQH